MGKVGKKKKQIRLLFIRKGTEKNKEYKAMENFYYTCLYDVLQNPEHRASRTEKVNRIKAQLIKAYRERVAAGMIEMQSLDSFKGEEISLFHIIKRRRRREKRTITQVRDLNGTKHVIHRNNGDLRSTLRAEIPNNTKWTKHVSKAWWRQVIDACQRTWKRYLTGR